MRVRETLRYFEDEDLAKEVKMTNEEWNIFNMFEQAILEANGLGNISGGYSSITIYDIDEDDEGNEVLLCECEVGEQNMGDGHSSSDKWTVRFNRNTKKFEEA